MFLLLMMSSSAFAQILADNYYTLQEVPFTWVGTYANRTIANKVYTYGDEAIEAKILWYRFTFYGGTDHLLEIDTNGNAWFDSVDKSKHSFNLAQSGARVISAWNNDLSSYYYGGVFMEDSYNQIVVEWLTETYTDEGLGRPNNFEVVIFKDGRIRIDYKSFNASTNKDFGSGISMGNGTALSITEKFGNVTTLAGRSFLYTPIPQSTSNPPAANLTATNTVQTFTIKNQGTGELNVNSLSLSGADAANFFITSSTCTGSALAGTETCTVQVAYNPTAAAPASAPMGAALKSLSLSAEGTSSGTSNTKVATLNIATNDPANPVLAVPMSAYTGTLTIAKTGYGSGLVTSNSGGINCGTTCTGTDTSLTLTATPDAGSIFTGWSGGGCAGTGTCTIVMSSDATVTAMFDTILPWVTVNPVANPSKTSTQTLTGTMKAGSTVTLSANTAAAFGALTYPTSTSWQCVVNNLAVGANTITVTANNQFGSKQANLSLTYQPFVAMTLSTNPIAADYQGTLGITVSSIDPAGSDILIEQMVDANGNGVIDAGDYVIRSFKVTEGIAAAYPNMQGDTDGAVNGVVTTSLNYFLTSDLYHAPGHYLFRVTKDTQNAVLPFTVTPVGQSQTISGMVTDGTNPIAGAMVQLTDKWRRHVAYAVADTSGNYVLNVKQAGDYSLLPVAYGYVATATPITLAASQNIVNQLLTLTAGTYHLTGNLKDYVSGSGITGVWVQASDGSNSGIAMTDSNGVYDLLLPSGQYSVSAFAGVTGPGSFAKGYSGFNNKPLAITVNGNMAASDITLPVGNIPVSGRVLDVTGNPVPGLAVLGKFPVVSEPVNFGIADSGGVYSLGLQREKGWNLLLDPTTAQTLGYIGTIHSNLTVNTSPVSGQDLTVYPVTAWVQGVVKDSANQLLSGVEVKLRNTDSFINASVFSANDGTYRLGAFAGSWFIDALTENKGTHPVTEQSFTLNDGQTAPIDFVVDVTPPTETINPVTSPTRVSSQTVTGTMEAGATITVSVNTTASVGTVSYPTSTTWSCDITGLTEGANAIAVTATDAAGNTRVVTSSITLDTTPPTVVITSPAIGISSNQTPVLTYSVSDGTVVVTVDNVVVNKVSGNTLDPLSYSSHTVRVEATDAAGNLGSASVTFTVNRPPAFNPTIISKANATVGLAYTGQTIAGAATDPDGDVISYSKISGPAWLIVAANGALSGTPTTAANDSFVVQAASTGGTATATLNITVAVAPVAQLNAWTNLYSAAPNNTSATNLAAGSFTVGSGSNRLLLVAVVMEIGTAANPTISASYGGTALTLIKVTANTQKEIVWMGYLKESQIGSGSKALTVTYSGATGNATGLHVKWAAFSGVNQTTPTASFGGVNTNTTSATFGSTLNYVTNGMTTVVAGNGGTPATGTLSATPAFTAGTATTTNAQTSRTFTTAKHTASGSYASTTPVTWSGTTSAWSGLVVVSLQP